MRRIVLTVSRHFCPRPSQKARDRAAKKQILQEGFLPKSSPYTIYWWRRTQLWEKTRQFWMYFKVSPDRNQVYDAFCKVFAGVRVKADGPFFVVNLEQEYTWGEVRGVVAIALKELVG